MKDPVMRKNNKGETFVLFFGAGKTNGVCSNWFMSPFTIGGVQFDCVEQYMMYMKAMVFGDKAIAKQVLNVTTPKEMKALGRKVRNYDDKVWGEKRLGVVTDGCYAKFSQNEELRKWLLSANVDHFVECSPYDRIWGIGIDAYDDRAIQPDKWLGQNLLGKALADARKRIMEEQKK